VFKFLYYKNNELKL